MIVATFVSGINVDDRSNPVAVGVEEKMPLHTRTVTADYGSCLIYIPVLLFNSSIFLLASDFPISPLGTFSPASLDITAMNPCCFPVALSSPVAHELGSWIGAPAVASGFFVSLFLRSLMVVLADDLFRSAVLTSTPFSAASV